jgi:hypothetical protein
MTVIGMAGTPRGQASVLTVNWRVLPSATEDCTVELDGVVNTPVGGDASVEFNGMRQ